MAKWRVQGTYVARYYIDTVVDAATADGALEAAIDEAEASGSDVTDSGAVTVEPADREAEDAQEASERWRRWFASSYVMLSGDWVTDGYAAALLDTDGRGAVAGFIVDNVAAERVKVFVDAAVAQGPAVDVVAMVRPCHAELFRLAKAGRLTSWARPGAVFHGVIAWRGDRVVGIANGFERPMDGLLRLEDVTLGEVARG